MFYSQFILAKKGPLGTIWIAAHLERKLRKNQVADTDIGVSVDSILFPDVPIALRLSSHLLLGVVRIYSRKVNYLFDDCSEALLKVKQAFRSAAVDLPPEESKAPYHSITLPETFDLDDFELPDNDIFQGNYVDHHVSSREQITLQDTMDGVGYSTTQFGLDERFGDGDAAGLDLDEELFLDQIGTSGQIDESGDPQASVQPMTPLKQDEHPQERTNSETMVDAVEEADIMDYAQAPCTPGLVEEPNLSNVQEASACDDHLDTDDHLTRSTAKENAKNVASEDKQEADWSSRDDINSNANTWMPPDENEYRSGGLETEQINRQGESPSVEATLEHVSLDKPSFRPSSDLPNLEKAENPALEMVAKITESSDVPAGEDLQNEVVNYNSIFSSANEPHDDPKGSGDIGLEDGAQGIPGLISTIQQESLGVEVPVSVGNAGDRDGSHPDASEMGAKNEGSCPDNPETQADQEHDYSNELIHDLQEKMALTGNSFLRPCNSNSGLHIPNSGSDKSMAADLQPHTAALSPVEISGQDKNAVLVALDIEKFSVSAVGPCHGPDDSDHISKENHAEEIAPSVEVHSPSSKLDAEVDNIPSEDKPLDNLSNPVEADLPAPEKQLSVVSVHDDVQTDMLAEASPRDLVGLNEDVAGSKIYSGKKRSLTESTLTEHSLNSVESSRIVRAKKTAETVPDDDDLLSSILVGRRSSALKLKPTPVAYEVTSVKRARSAQRSGAVKRKVLMDDTMVLHGDMIRQQLINTEDVRRVRKKAPCTRPEISMIQKQYLEDEVFLEPILTGLSIELASMHSQEYDLAGIRICQNDVTGSSLDNVAEFLSNFKNEKNNAFVEDVAEPRLACQDDKNDSSLENETEPHLISQNDENRTNWEIPKDEGSNEPNVTEESGMGVNGDILLDKNNDVAEHTEILVNDSSLGVEVKTCEEPVGPTSDGMELDVSQKEIFHDTVEQEANDELVFAVEAGIVDGVVSSSIMDHVSGDREGASAGTLQEASLHEMGEANSSANVDTLIDLPDKKIDATFNELDISGGDVSNEKAISTDEVKYKNGDNTFEGETEPGILFNVQSETARHDSAVEMIPDSSNGELEGESEPGTLFNVQSETVRHDAAVEQIPDSSHGELDRHNHGESNDSLNSEPNVGSHPAQVSVHMEEGSLNDGENSIQKECYSPNMTDAEAPGSDMNDRDGLDYSAPVNDTEFLNVDDEDVTEMTDDNMPDAEETRFTENSGWSSRTRAVSNYLQTLFEKEAEFGRKTLSTDNLLIGKTRKEASRMFFEALVLKTRDYIHVEQRHPFDDIIIKPRIKLLKSNF